MHSGLRFVVAGCAIALGACGLSINGEGATIGGVATSNANDGGASAEQTAPGAPSSSGTVDVGDDAGGAPIDSDAQGGTPVDAAAPDDAPSSTLPGVLCGLTTCPLPQVCCVKGSTQTCVANAAACAAKDQGARACDDPTDCAAGTVCCYTTDTDVPGTQCLAACPPAGGDRAPACRTQSDCASGTCAARPCKGGISVLACAPLTCD
jgi:hypothetical protein